MSLGLPSQPLERSAIGALGWTFEINHIFFHSSPTFMSNGFFPTSALTPPCYYYFLLQLKAKSRSQQGVTESGHSHCTEVKGPKALTVRAGELRMWHLEERSRGTEGKSGWGKLPQRPWSAMKAVGRRSSSSRTGHANALGHGGDRLRQGSPVSFCRPSPRPVRALSGPAPPHFPDSPPLLPPRALTLHVEPSF